MLAVADDGAVLVAGTPTPAHAVVTTIAPTVRKSAARKRKWT
jgi:hypothetical protein